MDAPTTTSAGNGTSGGGGGWFTPRKQPAPTPDGEQETVEGRRLAGLRTLGRSGASTGGDQVSDTQAEGDVSPADAEHRPGPDGHSDVGVRVGVGADPGRTTDAARAADAGAFGERPAPDQNTEAERIPDSGAPSDAGVPVTAPPAATPPAMTPGTPRTLPGPTPAETAVGTPQPPSLPDAFAAAVPRATCPAASPDAVLIRRTMAEVAPVANKLTSYFYALLFVRHPELRALFPAAMDTQRDRLLRALLTAVEHLDDKPTLIDYLQQLGRGHRKYGTKAEHYPAVGESLIGALSRYAGTVWDTETEAAWVRAYTTISQVMIDAAAVDELRAPPWWQAEVVTHELRTPDVAVVTVRPDQPYPFFAGQYTSLETPWWPRVWRHYSFASAPRSDGLLTFHVKAVPAGWVSNALVHRARPGDVVRLGPPSGSMTVDHTTDSGLLCLGGGTGIAPIKALVEDVAEHGERRPVEVFYGARTDLDLYDIDTMLRLQQVHPWLSVRAIIDELAHVQLPDALREYGPWTEYDAYLSGPPGMIRRGVHTLKDIGVPSERIRHDSVEELVAAGT
ncbi:globin domain-containing protein [Streptomyces sp. NPDC088789]|uniref:globin domain-containing protein n=1 Tax=Streptomyces sp. NPDC088789 TaxID=3365899 RepID=UPI0038089E3F